MHTYIGLVLVLTNAMLASEITQWSRNASNFSFNLVCELYPEYLIQRSTNLIDWETLRRSSGPSTNRFFQLAISNNPTSPHMFFRAAQTNEPFFGYGIVAKQNITLGAGGSDTPWMDSFDSSNPDYSSNGQYDPLKRKDKAFVATLSSARPAISTGSGEIWGSAATGPNGTITGTVGDGFWNTTTSGIQPGHVRDDFALNIPEVNEPTSSIWNPLPVTRILNNKDYKITGDLTRGFVVVGNVRLWVTRNIIIGGGDYISLQPGASLEIFIGQISGLAVAGQFGGNGIMNATAFARNCTIWGLPTCTSITYSGGAALTGRIYAPSADVRLTGGSDFYGAVVGNSVNCNGSIGIHQDEALGK